MAVGDIERLVEGLVNRGLVSPKMVGRTVGQATIDTLQNLGKDMATSQIKLEREQEQRLSNLRSRALVNQASVIQAPSGSARRGSVAGLLTDITKPFLLGQIPAGPASPARFKVAMPSGQGRYKIEDIIPENTGTQSLIELARANSPKNVPLVNLSTMHNIPQTLEEITSKLYRSLGNVGNAKEISKYLSQLTGA